MRLAVLGTLLLLSTTACDGALNDASEDSQANVVFDGAVHLPLTGRTTEGVQYRLKHVTFEIAGAAMFTLSDRDAKTPDADALVTTLPAGSYHVYVRPGFEVVEIGADGHETAASAELASNNPLSFDVGRTADARLKLALQLNGQKVIFGEPSSDRVTSAALDNAL